jgi:hypothetical protein
VVAKTTKENFQARDLNCMVKSCPIQCTSLDFRSRKAQKFSTHVVRQLAMYIVS